VPRGNCTFRQSDLAKALKAAKDAGMPIVRFEIDRDGKIAVVVDVTNGTIDTASTLGNEHNDFGS
jgi:hypothetical protein